MSEFNGNRMVQLKVWIGNRPNRRDFISNERRNSGCSRKGSRMGGGGQTVFSMWPGVPSSRTRGGASNDAKCIDEIVLVVRKGMRRLFQELAAKFKFQKPFRIVVGGAERQDSVWNGLKALSATAEMWRFMTRRGLYEQELIAATIKRAGETGAAVAAQPVTDTIKNPPTAD